MQPWTYKSESDPRNTDPTLPEYYNSLFHGLTQTALRTPTAVGSKGFDRIQTLYANN